jgi:hypothetical protein
MAKPPSVSVAHLLSRAARSLETADPTPVIWPLLERTFPLPAGDPRYGNKSVTPGAAPIEPSFSEMEPNVLRFTKDSTLRFCASAMTCVLTEYYPFRKVNLAAKLK